MEKEKADRTEMTQRISRDSLNSLETKTIPVICPWCNSIFKMSMWEVDKNKKTGVTHGICPECMEKTLKDAASPKESPKWQPGVFPGTAAKSPFNAASLEASKEIRLNTPPAKGPIDAASLGASKDIRFGGVPVKIPAGTQKPEEAKQGAADKLRNFFKLKK